MLLDYQIEFIEFALLHNVLRFGSFTLKSGRHSPYFFNTGAFHGGTPLLQLGRFYAKTLQQHAINFDLLFGPAYKGIPLATATSIALANLGLEKQVCFNRKEIKSHGEMGHLMGAPLHGDVVIIDDVITSGLAKKEAIELIHQTKARVAGIVIAFDRQEPGENKQTAVSELIAMYQIPVCSIIALDHLIFYLEQRTQYYAECKNLKAYRDSFAFS
ncbi:MAG TPA: orotate phosphoribosyltransferase [Gammaproteobacteria bacterium]|nr:orotate phosphoribosyltransferase [Gammaproteobacteria bacterium]